MASNSYMIKFGADASSVTKAINNLNTDMRSLKSVVSNTNTAFKLTGDTSVLDTKLSALNKIVDITEKKAVTLRQKLADLAESNGGELPQTAEAKKLSSQLESTEGQLIKFKALVKNTENMKAGDSISDGFDKAGKSIERAGEKTNLLHSGIQKAGGVMSTFVGMLGANIVGAGLAAVGSVFAGMTGGIIDASDALNKFTGTMNFAGKSKKEIDQVTKASQDYADKTVYDLNTVLNTTAQLAANGVGGYQKLTEAAGNLNAVAGGNADTFQSVAMVLTQTAGAGKLTTDNWNQLADAIPGASGKLQEAMKKNGAYTGNFRDAMEKGQITSKEFNKAISDLGMTKAAKDAATSTSTIEGAMGNLQASFQTAGREMLDAIKPALTGVMSSIADAVPKVTAALGKLFKGINASGITKAFSAVGKALTDSIGQVDLSGITTSLSAIGKTVSATFGKMDFSGLTNLVSAILPAVSAGFTTFMQVASPAISSVVSAFGNLWNAIQPILTAIGSVLMPVFKILGGYLGGVFSGIMSTVSVAFNVLAGVAKFLTPVIQWIAKAFNALAPYIQTAVTWFGKAQGSFRAMGGIFKAIGSVLGSVGGAIAQAFSSMGSKLGSIFGGVKAAFGAVGRLFGSVGSSIGRVASGVVRYFANIGGKIAGGFGNVVGKIAGTFSGVGKAIFSKFGNLSKIGMNVVKGIASGITSGYKFLKSVISSFVGNTVSFIKKLFKIHSPSRLMRDEVGTYITQGIGVGMTDQKAMGTVQKSIGTVTNSIVGGFGNVTTGTLNGNIGGTGSMAPNAAVTTQAGTNVLTFNISGSDPTRTANEVRKVLRQEKLI